MKTKRYTEKATVELIWQIENSTINTTRDDILKGKVFIIISTSI